jgi:hypothetical protein
MLKAAELSVDATYSSVERIFGESAATALLSKKITAKKVKILPNDL